MAPTGHRLCEHRLVKIHIILVAIYRIATVVILRATGYRDSSWWPIVTAVLSRPLNAAVVE
jgi:hypothetical protein